MKTPDYNNPYTELPEIAFWKSGVVNSSPYDMQGLYKKKWQIKPGHKIATAGSCFAQHIARNLKSSNYNVLDLEPAPAGLPATKHNMFGYSMYSARYGNIYTVRQLLQLIKEATGELKIDPNEYIWEKNGRYYDAFRPAIEPNGFESPSELMEHRQYHLTQVTELFATMDVFVFTLGLTETWQNKHSGLVFPTAPGTIAGSYDPDVYCFKNFNYKEIMKDFKEVTQLLKKHQNKDRPIRYILTVSPVPLTATKSDMHILQATTYSKSVLRAVVGDLSNNNHIDYFPSFEVITNINNRGLFYENNLRSIRAEGVASVMKLFFSQHGAISTKRSDIHSANQNKEVTDDEDIQCEEALLEAFGEKK